MKKSLIVYCLFFLYSNSPAQEDIQLKLQEISLNYYFDKPEAGEAQQKMTIIINDSTGLREVNELYLLLKKDLLGLISDTNEIKKLTDDLYELNKTNVKISGPFLIGKYKTKLHSSVKELFKSGTLNGWSKFYDKFPDSPGFIILSRFKISVTGKFASGYFKYSCGPLCGKGIFLLLEKKNNIWTVVFEKILCIS